MREDGWDDDIPLAAALREAMRAQSQIPPELVETVKNEYAWRTIDAELADLTFDSSREPEAVAWTRSEPASIRALTFTSVHLTIEVEVTESYSLIGQVIPPGRGSMEAQTRDGVTVTAPVDEIGCFLIEPVPPGTFRLRYRNHGADVVTCWLPLSSGSP